MGQPDQGGEPQEPEAPNTNNGGDGPDGGPGGEPETDDGEPVYLRSGEFVHTVTDMTLRCRGINIVLKRTYRSKTAFNGPFGYGWFMSYYWRLKRLTDGNALILTGSGYKKEFTFDSSTATFTPPVGTFDALEADGVGGFVLTRKRGLKHHFNPDGCLSKIVTRHGNTLTFVYDPAGKLPINGVSEFFVDQTTGLIAMDYRLTAIQDPVGREVTLSYDADGRLLTITDWGGRSVGYAYDVNNNLTSVTKPGLEATEYDYDAPEDHNWTSATDPSGATYLQNVYNAEDRVVSQVYGRRPDDSDATYAFSYNDPGESQVTVSNRRGYKTVHTLDENGRALSRKRYRADETTFIEATYTYNADGRRTSVTFPLGNSMHYTYDGRGNRTSIRRRPPGGDGATDIVTTLEYDPSFDLLASYTDAAGHTTTYTRDAFGNATKIDRPGLGTFTYTYNAHGQVLTQTDPHGTVTEYDYDANGYLVEIVRDSGGLNAATSFQVDEYGNVTQATDPLGNVTAITYNERDQITSIDPPEVPATSYSYNDNGLLETINRPEGDTTTYTYDMLDNRETITSDLGTTTFVRDGEENITQVTDGNGNSTTYVLDEFDRITSETDAEGNTTQYEYDANGNLTKLTDASTPGNVTDYEYDGYDRRIKMIYPSPEPFEEFGYDGLGRLTSMKTRSGDTLAFAYDGAGRLTTNGRFNAAYVYDGLRLTSATGPSGAITFSGHNALHRVGAVTYPGGQAFSYEYDLAGSRTKMTYPDGDFITYVPDGLGRIDEIRNAGSDVIADYTYDDLSRPTALAYLNGTTVSRQYESARKLSGIESRKADDSRICGYEYTYDIVGNRTSKALTHLGRTETYEYDNIYQLTKAAYGDGAFEDLGKTTPYDPLGNRVQTSNGGITDYATNELNQYTSVGGVSFEYDDNGNLIFDGARSFAYNPSNQLTGATANGHNSTYTYDAFGRRATKTVDGTTTTFLYDGIDCAVELDAGGAIVAKYIHGGRIDEVLTMTRGGQTYYYHPDALGSIGAVTDSDGNTVESYTYKVFGQPTVHDENGVEIGETAIGNDFLFTGRRWDAETGLYYYRLRMYDSGLGRFMQLDPLGYLTGVNLYEYCGNNPGNWMDPFGLAIGQGEIVIGGRRFWIGGRLVTIPWESVATTKSEEEDGGGGDDGQEKEQRQGNSKENGESGEDKRDVGGEEFNRREQWRKQKQDEIDRRNEMENGNWQDRDKGPKKATGGADGGLPPIAPINWDRLFDNTRQTGSST